LIFFISDTHVTDEIANPVNEFNCQSPEEMQRLMCTVEPSGCDANKTINGATRIETHCVLNTASSGAQHWGKNHTRIDTVTHPGRACPQLAGGFSKCRACIANLMSDYVIRGNSCREKGLAKLVFPVCHSPRVAAISCPFNADFSITAC
jgi:hypothetical protein